MTTAIPTRDASRFRSELDRIHPFERSGFGHAPYRCTGTTEAKIRPAPGVVLCGESCQYCGTGIMDVYHVESSDGVAFVVGSDCIRRVYADFDGKIPTSFREAFTAMERAKREVRRAAKLAKLRVRVERAIALMDAHDDLFASRPHPNAYYASIGRTYRDYLEWSLNNRGDAGVNATCRLIETAVATKP